MPLWALGIFNSAKSLTLKQILIAAGALLVAYLIWDRGALKLDLSQQKSQIQELSDANSLLTESLAKQTAAVQKAKQDSDAMRARYQAAMRTADKSDSDHQKAQSAILMDKVAGDHCAYTHRLFSRYMKERHNEAP